ncbi:NUDIX hydrolase [Slackia isoflavoniconvertens]|nr:NUDIX hydrolase [Slackia isoflavoniconvertens]
MTTKSFFVVKSVTIRNEVIRLAPADARRRLSPFAMLVVGRDSRFRGGVAVLFCFARVVAIQWCRLKNAAVNAADQVAFEGAIMEEDVCTASFDETAGLPELLGIEQVGDGWIKKYILTYRLPNGRELKYDVVSRKGLEEYRSEIETLGTVAPQVDAVCIVGHTANDEFLLIREFRFPMNRMCVAFPAGLREPGEDVVECAARELREETGFDLVRDECGQPVSARACVQPGFSSLGMGDESIAMVFAEVERVAEPRSESTEFIESFLLPRGEVPAFLRENRDPLSIRCQLVLEMVAQPPFEFGVKAGA